MDNDPFSPDYVTARTRVLGAATQLGWRLERYPIAGLAADPALTIDVALGPGNAADPVLVISSGTHGVEGFFGSAVQLSLLEQWAGGAMRGIRCVLIHALNPFGFAHLRRADQDNIDLNRNFVNAGDAYAGADPMYARLDRLLNPRRPFSSHGAFRLRMLAAAARYGPAAVRKAVAAGQYDFPRGVFFGGHGPSAARTVLETHLARWTGTAREVVHLDLHTGLGSWAECRLLVDYPMLSTRRARAEALFGVHALDTLASGGLKYAARGGLGGWCASVLPGVSYLFAYLEVGTYRQLDVIEGLRAENQVHHFGASRAGTREKVSARLKELFCPADDEWRADSLRTAHEIINHVVHVLA